MEQMRVGTYLWVDKCVFVVKNVSGSCSDVPSHGVTEALGCLAAENLVLCLKIRRF
jgi:hypothetical protein